MRDSVDILVAAYNGETFIRDQLESLLQQSHSPIRILARDDGSSDETPSLLEWYAKKFPGKVVLLPSEGRLGVRQNFSQLLVHSRAPYIMLADQDDVWFLEKVAKTLKCLKQMEKKHGRDVPLLVHTDLAVVNERLEMVSPSYWDYANLTPHQFLYLNRLLMQNVVTGCTMMMNRTLVDLAAPIPEQCMMHDWWMALVASALGKIGILEEATLYYRQHGRNTLGAKKFWSAAGLLEKSKKVWRYDENKYKQAEELLSRYYDMLEPYQREILEVFLEIPHCSLVRSRYILIKYGFLKSGAGRQLMSFFFQRHP